MKEWLTSTEIADAKLPDMPQTRQGVDFMVSQLGWRATPQARMRTGRGGGFEYHVSLLPEAAHARLVIAEKAETEDEQDAVLAKKNEAWTSFNALPKARKAACEERLKVLRRVDELAGKRGITRIAAIAMATHDADVQMSAYYEWRKTCEGYDPEDWLAALAKPFLKSEKKKGVAAMAECHPDAWNFLKSDYLRPERPAFSACYRRMRQACETKGWRPVPSESALRRRLDTEVSKAVVVLTREGKDRAKQLFPAQRRTRADMHAMQAVNMDGHKLDLFVRLPNRKKPTRVFLIGIQDLYSAKILSWRLSEAETWDAARLVIGDMVEAFGIPESIDLDNGRAFASKKISGGAKTRYRNKINPDDPDGLLVTLGIKPRFVLPYSGQSKPIERAWRDLAENISRHPVCSGAYTGPNPLAKPENYMKTAIALDDLKHLVAMQIAEHNARTGRNTETAKGRSFDQTFAESMAAPSTIVRVASKAQRFLWLLSAEAIKTHKGSGEIHYQGNRYWNVELNQYMGKKVTIRFDPDALHEPMKVYDLQNRFICEAECIDDVGHHSTEDGRAHGRLRTARAKALAAAAEADQQLTPMQLGAILERGRKAEAKAKPVRSTVTRLATGNLAVKQQPDAISEEELSASFSTAIARISGDASILEFPKGNAGGK